MAKYKKVCQISWLKLNDRIKDLFVVRFKKPVQKTSTDNFYFTLKIQDGYGDMLLKYWGGSNQADVEKLYDSIKADDVIYVEAVVRDFRDRLELNVNEGGLRVLKEGEYDITDFIRKSDKNPDEMMDELEKIIEGIENPEYKTVLNAFFADQQFKNKFKYAPAAMYKHHGWISGLLEHTLSVVHICADIARYHSLDEDLLLTGAILHDIGKITEFETTSLIKVTDKGNLLGHITMGVQMLSAKLEGLDVSEVTKNKLLHMVISHHGSKEYGSPKLPSFPEAFIVAKADELDALAVQMIDFKENAQTEDSFIYSKDFETNIYLK
jgi:3'-5' exoribonuclease